MHVLVTGGAGYLGAVLVPALLDAGHRVTVLDNFLFRQTPLLDCVHDERLTVIRGDARDRETLREPLRSADAVLPLACLTGAPLCDRDPFGAESVILGALDLRLRLRARDQRLVYPTTNSGYGIGEPGLRCTETSPLRPVSLYGRLKVEAERRILEAGDAITLRLATAFGISPRMRLDLLVNDFTYRAVTDRFIVLFEPRFKRNFIHVRDVARAFLHALEHFDTMRDQAYNVGLDDANLDKVELCEVIRRHVPGFVWTEAPIGRDPDKRDYIVSNEKIARTGFASQVSLDRGVAELVRGYRILRRGEFSNLPD